MNNKTSKSNFIGRIWTIIKGLPGFNKESKDSVQLDLEGNAAPEQKKSGLRFNIQGKMVAMGLLVVIAFITLIQLYMIPQWEKGLVAEKELKMKEQVEIVSGIVDHYYQQSLAGKMSVEEAKSAASSTIKGLRYGPSLDEYFWISTTDITMVMHPNRPDYDGYDVSLVTDATGKAIFVDCANLIAKQKEGYTSYMWKYKDEINRFEQKTCYVQLFEPWGWIVGTDIFMVDIQEAISAQKIKVSIIGSIVALIAALLIFVLSGFIARNIKKINTVIDRLSLGDVELNVDIKSADETGAMARSLNDLIRYLKFKVKAAESIANGDCTVKVSPRSEKDVLGFSFKRMVANLNDLIEQIKRVSVTVTEATQQLADAAEQSGSASTQVASVAQQVAKGSEEQSKSIYEANAAIERLNDAIELVTERVRNQRQEGAELGKHIKKVSEYIERTACNAREATEGAMQAAEMASGGAQTVEKTIEGIDKINLSMQDVTHKIKELGQHSEQIGSMISVIDDIAAQTNLLALNAAVEAARQIDRTVGEKEAAPSDSSESARESE